MTVHFEWDANKDASNIKKHGVTFETAIRAFADPQAVTVLDRIEGNEMRWQTTGRVDETMLLLVAHTLWEDDEFGESVEIVRIISAREATRKERQFYERENR